MSNGLRFAVTLAPPTPATRSATRPYGKSADER